MGWFVSRQHYWDSGVLAVEIATGGLDHASPDMLVSKYRSLGEGKEFADAREAAEAAIAVRRQWAKDSGKRIALAFGDADINADTTTQKEMRAIAEKAYEKADKCAGCGKMLGPKRSRFELIDDPFGEEFCSENCAEQEAEYREKAERELAAEEEMEPNPSLRSTRNTGAVERLVRSAAAQKFGRGRAQPIYEHNQWFVSVDDGEDGERLYSVVDAHPGIGSTGLDFEAL
jgi:hypothetical protein